MRRPLAIYLAGLVGAAAVGLLATSLWIPVDPAIAIQVDSNSGSLSGLDILAGLAFWTAVTLIASSLPVRVSDGVQVAVSTAPLMAAAVLGGPTAAAWIALIGTTESRELRGRVAWYGTLTNHAVITLPAILGALAIKALRGASSDTPAELMATLVGTLVYFILNLVFVSLVVVLRHGRSLREFLTRAETTNVWANALTLAPLGWFMARMYQYEGGAWTTVLFGLPLFTTRIAYQRFIEMREMFTQTIGALAEAVDKRDPFTSKHSQRVRSISVDIGRQMRVSAGELEALEWGGLLHDVGKIGVPDSILLKQGKLTREERIRMNSHPVLGAQIIGPVDRLAPELPVIRHHHEWYNGSGYPDRLMGDEIPKLARILHVADAFEAMTADRPYRKALSIDQALAELRKFAGVQFDPEIVDAFVKTTWAEDASEPGDTELRPIPLLGQHGARAARNFDGPAPGSPAADPA
ncbi:MAG TPA: HD-GYP domain-containing protein [Patescibacteria group bacterium]|nr:HD-GYP domain-containing protein [Patescibacteria group bacterium]